MAERSAWRSVALVSEALSRAGVDLASVRLIGGAMVTLHVRRLGLDHVDIRATVDADIGVPSRLVASGGLVDRLSELFPTRPAGNRWVSVSSDGAVLAVDVLVHDPSARVGPVRVEGREFDRAPGLWVALARPHVPVLVSTGEVEVVVALPDVVGSLSLKLGALSIRNDSKDVEDVLRLLECAAAAGTDPADIRDPFRTVSGRSWSETSESLVAPLLRIAEGRFDRAALGATRSARLVALARRFSTGALPPV